MQAPENWRMYLAIAAAAVFKNSLNKHVSFPQALLSTFTAVSFAFALTPGVAKMFGVGMQSEYLPVVAAGITLFGEHFAMLVLKSKTLADLVTLFRGGMPK